MKKFFLPVILLAASTVVLAQYQGPSEQPNFTAQATNKAIHKQQYFQQLPVTTVAEIIKSGVDDQLVKLEGKISKHLYKDKYEFVDTTGKIIAEIKDKVFIGQTVNEQTQIQLIAKIDEDDDEPSEIEVKSLQVLK